MKNQQTNRSKETQVLSKDHHIALFFACNIEQGVAKKTETQRIRDYVNYYWDNHLKSHFFNEEVLLFKRFSSEEACIQALKDHEEIFNLIKDINDADEGDYEVFKELHTYLEQHTSYEEKVVFPHLETLMPNSTLKHIGYFMEKKDQGFKAGFNDEFWN